MCVKQELMHMYGLPKSGRTLRSNPDATVSEGFTDTPIRGAMVKRKKEMVNNVYSSPEDAKGTLIMGVGPQT